MSSCLIAGCGWLGEALGIALADRGNVVWGLRRNAADLDARIRPLEADLSEPATLSRLPSPLDAVVYAAAPERGDEAAYRSTYVEGLGNLLDAVAIADAEARPRVVLLSSTSVYGQTGGEWVDEQSLTEPQDFRGRIVLEGERLVARSGLPSTTLRLGGLYGPGRESMIDAVRNRTAVFDPGHAHYTNRIHREDAAGAIVHLLDLPAESLEAVYIGVDEEPAARNDVLSWIASRLEVDLDTASGFDASGGSERRRDTDKRCSSARLRASGYRFRYPTYREGYGALIAARR
jgi:nucleoside-diphosphate-sugar epimerase